MRFKLIALFIITALFTSCISFKPITTNKIDAIHINSAGNKGLDITIDLVINNPNGFAIHVNAIELDLVSNSVQLGHVSSKEKFRIPKKSTVTQQLIFTVSLKSTALATIPTLLSLIGTKNVTISANGFVKAKAMLINKRFDVNFTDGIKMK